ncbi:MAG: GNAT family N-acetyltransferase [Bacteroidales bacterium]|nr:GNAT family N-acetyltransferase [Bacteroidales bacterium]
MDANENKDSLSEFEIRTERLIIRDMNESDAPGVLEILSDPQTARDAGVPCIKTIEEARKYARGGWVRGLTLLSVLKKDDPSRMVGIMEIYPFLDLEPASLEETDCLGYYMKKCCRGMGYMTEAVKALSEDLFLSGVTGLSLGIFPWNEASKKVAVKSGFSFVTLVRGALELPDKRKEDLEYYVLYNPYELEDIFDGSV